ncbi:MAG: hypothetical protein M1812_007231 [Candelaria pacifica]|nr:MAG: hypothetical protein M1812_007231 [Candelaria pacifica]
MFSTLLVLLGLSAVLASPTPAVQTDEEASPAGPTELPAVVDNSPDRAFSNPEFNTRTTLFGFEKCTSQQSTDIRQAFVDAITLAKAVGNPDNINFDGKYERDYFGRDSKDYQKNIRDNFKRAQAPANHWVFGDFWYYRNFHVRCDDPGDQNDAACRDGLPAYEVDLADKKHTDTQYHIINLCPDFFKLDSLATKIKNTDNNNFGFYRDDVRTLTCMGSTFLHEAFHTRKTYHPKNDPGFSDPQTIDRSITGRVGKAYGPAKAKALARLQDWGSYAAYTNTDNYVYYAVAIFMDNRYHVRADKPPFSWPQKLTPPAAGVIDPVDGTAVSHDTGAAIEDRPYYSDIQLYQQVP